MLFIKIKRFMPFSTKQMFCLVNDINNYSNFLDNCKSSKIDYSKKNEIVATLQIKKGSINSYFTTKNFLYPYKKIEMYLLKGPIKNLKGLWKFDEFNKGSIIELKLIFELDNYLMNKSMKFLLDIYSKKILNSFYERAKYLYEKK
jgi:ribosome-associated toxin RatA of RatAB toxin-antitoxin module